MIAFAALLVAACSDDPEEDSPSDSIPDSLTATPPQDGITWRWANVTVEIPVGSGIDVTRYVASDLRYPPDGGPVLELILGASFIQLDAKAGDVISRSEGEVDSELENVLSTLEVGPKPSVEELPWPYVAEPRPEEIREQGNIRYSVPGPGAGIVLAYGCGSGEGGVCWVQIENEQSKRAVAVKTGETIEAFEDVALEDKAAFDRWRQSVELVVQ